MKPRIFIVLWAALSAMISTGAFATVPDLIPVQGVLADSADLPIDALTDMTFTLYDGEASSTVLWTDTFVDVDVVEGFFTVYLGDNTALDFGSLITNAEVWVGITVESDPEMDRFQLATVPFAIEAQVSQQVGSLTEGDIITTSDPAGAITTTQVSNWDAAYGWGDHGAAGYLTSESDPVYSADPAAGIATSDITSWDTAVSWGDHAGLYTWNNQACGAGLVADGVDAAGVLQCTPVTSAHITDGTVGVADINTSEVQQRVTGACSAENAIRVINADGSVTCEPIPQKQCITIYLDNRSGTTTKYSRFNVPFACYPPFMSPGWPGTAPQYFGCTAEMWNEHHSGNNAGYWRGNRSANISWWPNGEGSGQYYFQAWDYSLNNVYNIQSDNQEVLLGSHWYNMCNFRESYYNGTGWTIGSPGVGGSWNNFGLEAVAYTRCALRICQREEDPGTYMMAERTAGPF